MTLNDIKLKRLNETARDREEKTGKNRGRKKLMRDPRTGAQIYVKFKEDTDEALEEGEKKHHTPKFVQHCVSAIMEKPKSEQPKEPFAVCHAARNKNKAKLDAAHRTGKHHTVKDYENALEKLREAVEERAALNIDPRNVTFGPVLEGEPTARQIRFSPY